MYCNLNGNTPGCVALFLCSHISKYRARAWRYVRRRIVPSHVMEVSPQWLNTDAKTDGKKPEGILAISGISLITAHLQAVFLLKVWLYSSGKLNVPQQNLCSNTSFTLLWYLRTRNLGTENQTSHRKPQKHQTGTCSVTFLIQPPTSTSSPS
jgi:hypothetical protein